jgi:hypothetical protein
MDSQLEASSVWSGEVLSMPGGSMPSADEIRDAQRAMWARCSPVWVKPEANPWTSIVMQAIAAEVELALADPDGPNMYRCAAPGYVSALYQTAGLRDIVEWDVGVELVTTSPVQYWEVISEHVSAAVVALERVDVSIRERIAATVIANGRRFEQDGMVGVPGMARCTTSRSGHSPWVRWSLHSQSSAGVPDRWPSPGQIPSACVEHNDQQCHQPDADPHGALVDITIWILDLIGEPFAFGPGSLALVFAHEDPRRVVTFDRASESNAAGDRCLSRCRGRGRSGERCSDRAPCGASRSDVLSGRQRQ